MQYVEISKFGPVEEAKVIVNKFTILIGEQASGKSTISRVIYFFKSLKEDLFTLVYNNFGDTNDFRTDFIRIIQDKFYQFFGSTRHMRQFALSYQYAENRNIILKRTKSKSLNVEFGYEFYGDIGNEIFALNKAINKPSNARNTYELIAYEESKEKFVLKLKEIVDDLFCDSRNSLYVPAGRNITVSYPSQFKFSFFGDISIENEKAKTNKKYGQAIDLHLMIDYMTSVERNNQIFFQNDFESLIRNEGENLSPEKKEALGFAVEKIEMILKGKYENNRFGERIVYDSKNNKYVHLHHASSGQQEVIRILQDLFIILLSGDSVFRIIEEPEAHLYPVAQKHLLELMALVANYTNSQIFITTHSPYILSVMNNLVFADILSDLDENIHDSKGFYIDDTSYSAYELKNSEGWEFQSIRDSESNLIGENYLDDISELLGEEFDELFEKYKSKINEQKSQDGNTINRVRKK